MNGLVDLLTNSDIAKTFMIPNYAEPVDWQLIDQNDLGKFISYVTAKLKNFTIY